MICNDCIYILHTCPNQSELPPQSACATTAASFWFDPHSAVQPELCPRPRRYRRPWWDANGAGHGCRWTATVAFLVQKIRKYQKHRANIRRISKVAWSWHHLTESFELAVGSCYSGVNDSELHSLVRNADMLWLILAVLLSHYLTRVRSYISHWVLACFQSLQRKQLRIQIPLEPPINASISKESKMMQTDAATQCLFCRVL